MRIAQIAPLWNKIPPQTYGGIERIVHILCDGLVARGHEVTLFATGDSQTRAKLQSRVPRGLTDMMIRGEAWESMVYINASLSDALLQSGSFDIMHNHSNYSEFPLTQLSKSPVLNTLHSAISLDATWLAKTFDALHISAISHAQITELPLERRKKIDVVPNGVDFNAYDFSTKQGEYLAFLGRMSPNKNPLGAIELARQVKLPIVLAGKAEDRAEEIYFEEKIKPLIDGKQVSWIGAVNQKQKNDFLKNASALIFPVQWDEPFGLVMIEAMACGTPVVACKRGAVSEVIDEGKTGFFAEEMKDLAALIPKALKLDRNIVREHAKAQFNHEKMIDEYLKVYQKLTR
jgi:glycosyltransferase involved in cell wall biosynthesis